MVYNPAKIHIYFLLAKFLVIRLSFALFDCARQLLFCNSHFACRVVVVVGITILTSSKIFYYLCKVFVLMRCKTW